MELTNEQEMFVDTLRDFLTEEIAPIVDQYEESGMDRGSAYKFLRKLADIGLGPASDDPLLPFREPVLYTIAAEEISRVWPSLTMTLTGCFPSPLLQWASEETKENNKEGIDSGEIIGALAITEPGSGSDTASPKTTAKKDNGYFVLNGEKTWISNAPIADIAIVVANVEDEDQEGFFLVDQKTSPFQTRPIEKLGWKGSPTGQIIFDDCRVPADNRLISILPRMSDSVDLKGSLLDVEGLMASEQPLNTILAFVRTGMASMATGISQACLDESLSFAQDRTTFGKPIAQHQLIQEKLYELKTITESSRHLTRHAARLIENGNEDARLYSSLAKGYTCEKCVEAANDAVQIHGANGLSEDYKLERYLRDARTMTIPDGTTEIQKLIVGYELTDLPAYA